MKKLPVILILFLGLCVGCDQTTNLSPNNESIYIIPYPKEISIEPQTLILSEQSCLYTPDSNLSIFLDLCQLEIELITGVKPGIIPEPNAQADIIFSINERMPSNEYSISVEEVIEVRAGSYIALTHGKTTLLQLMFSDENKLHVPKVQIKDRPSANYRGLMIDLARNWHSVESIKKIIDLAAFYKTNYIQLHFSDYQSYTLPSKKYPRLSTPDRHYTFDDLVLLEEYARLRGVILIPEIDIPGHSSSMVNAYPDLFGIDAIDENPWIINMGKEEVYTALEEIIREIVPIFKSSPYFHIGGDEAIFYKITEDKEVQAYMLKNNLSTEHEVYRHFLVRMNNIVKGLGKQMCVWEGFRREGKVQIPKDILVYEFETNRYLPNHLVEDGYSVVNTSWKPLYVVNKKKWEPKTIYHWNMWRWENWFPNAPSYDPIQLGPDSLVIGAQMCAWEQAEETEIPSLRKRLPVMNERIWNLENNPDFDSFMQMLEQLDYKLSLLIKDDRQDAKLHDYNYVDDRETN